MHECVRTLSIQTPPAHKMHAYGVIRALCGQLYVVHDISSSLIYEYVLFPSFVRAYFILGLWAVE
jgi:hypothetical protein